MSIKPCIVCIDDEAAVLASLERLLRHEPYDFLTTEHPDHAFALMEERQAEILIADMRMPEMRGTDVLRIARERFPWADRVMLTGYADVAAVAEAVNDAGVRRVIRKPWNDEELKRSLRDLLAERVKPDGKGGVPREVLDHVDTAIATIGEGGRRLACWNRAFLRLAGAPEDRSDPAAILALLPTIVIDRVQALLARPGIDVLRDVAFAGGTATIDLRSMKTGPEAEVMLISRRPSTAASRHESTSTETRTRRLMLPSAAEPLTGQLETLNAIFSASFDPVIVFDRDGLPLYANRAAGTVAGVDPAAVPGRTWTDLGLPTATLERFDADVRHVLRTGRTVRDETAFPAADGLRDFEYILTPILDMEGAVQAVVCTARDVTHRRRAEADMRDLTVVLDNASEGIVRLDPSGTVLFANRACSALLQRPDLAGKPLADALKSEDREAFRTLLQAVPERGRMEAEFRGERGDGAVLPLQALVVADVDHGTLAGFYGFLRDVTERRRSGDDLAKMEARLLQAQKLHSIGQLSAGIAHEINNPTGYIISNLTTLVEYLDELSPQIRGTSEHFDALLDDFRQAIMECRQGAERIRDIVRSLTEFSHVDEGRAERTDLNQLVESAIRLCWNELKYRATIHREFGDVPPVLCYSQRIVQVIVNLLLNAAQAIADRGEIRIATTRDGDHAVVAIRDTGCGIAAEALPRVFDPFFTTKPAGSGTGLGLYIARQIVQAHGGRIDVTSAAGEGTEFTIRLPFEH